MEMMEVNGGGGVIGAFQSLLNSKEEVIKPPQWQLDLLMEKLRQKSKELKPLGETSKNIRQALMERRYIIDQSDKMGLQRSLDSLQQAIKVNSLQSMVERLEMVARQLGLKFTPGATGHEWFIHSDMFYLELLIDAKGGVDDVKIQHEGKTEQQSCPEIVESLKKTDFQDFAAHLQGLVSIYQLNADKKIKSKAYIALQCLEADLASMWATYSNIKEGDLVVMKTPLGIFQPRKGGHAVKLVYFVTPYEFLDVGSKTSLPNDVSTVTSRKVGSVATIHIQASMSHKLQMNTTVTVSRTSEGKSVPRYASLTATNSTTLPACFVLRFDKPIPMCISLVKAIHSATEIESCDLTYTQPILELITNEVSNGALNLMEKGLFVALPDQVHCYFMTETPSLEGIMVSSIAFTTASQLPQVISILRQQLAFNTLVGSCIRIGSKPELEHIVFEVNALSHQKLSLSFQHPLDDSLVTLEFDLRDIMHPHCQLQAVTNVSDIIPTLEEHACKVVKRSMSIPVTMRAVIRRWQNMKAKLEPPPPDFSVAVGGSGMNTDVSRLNDRTCGAESGDRRSHSGHQNVMVPPGIMNFSSSVASSVKQTIPSAPYSMSPIGIPNQTSQAAMDIISSYMNPFLGLANPIGMGTGSPFPSLTSNLAMQMLATQMGQAPTTPSQMLMGLLDQVGGAHKRRKRKNTADSLPTPSPKASPQHSRPSHSPLRSNQKPPMRRQSDGFESGGIEKTAMSMLMSELGVDQLPDSRWNIDITPVHKTSSSESVDDLETFKKQMHKKMPPKRSMSLDSHSSEDIPSIQSLLESQGQEFKPLVTPSLSITPVSSANNTSVSSLLASIRPGIEIIPLSNTVSIPSSLTVTPIIPNKNIGSDKSNDKQSQKKPKDRLIAPKRKLDGTDTEVRPTKLPFLDGKGRIPPGMNLIKKTSAPALLGSPSKPLSASLGKPSMSAMRSVSSPNSPKVVDSNGRLKPKKPNMKPLKSIAGIGSVPPLKAITHILSAPAIKQEPSSFELAKSDLKPLIQPNVAAALQQAAASLIASSGQKPQTPKKGGLGLAAVIDKLKSVHSSVEAASGGDKKEPSQAMSAKDYLKASSAMNDVLQQKKALAVGSNLPGQEYMVKGAQGLKLTINKAKLKDPSRSPKAATGLLKSPMGGVKKSLPGIKPSSSLSALSANLASLPKKPVTAAREPKDAAPKQGTVLGKIKDVKSPRPEDLTKKLFLPGSVKSLEAGTTSAPIFDPNKFQIPKKPRSNNNSGGSAPANIGDISNTKSGNENTSTGQTTPSSADLPLKDKALATTGTAEGAFVGSTDAQTVPSRAQPPALIEVASLLTTKLVGLEHGGGEMLMESTNNEGSNTVSFGGSLTEFTSPESPDPVNLVVNDTAPQTIPTTPLNPVFMNEESPILCASTVIGPSQSAVVAIVDPDDVDEDAMVIDEPASEASQTMQNGNESQNATIETLSQRKSEEKIKSPQMPPPPAPVDLSNHAQPVQSPILAAVPSPKPVASPIGAGATVSIAIVHSPKPPTSPSPAILRSPLVVAPSPVATSPCQIDDDLMDEALIGGGGK